MVYALALTLVVLAAATAGLLLLGARWRAAARRLQESVDDAAAARDHAQALLSVAEAVNSSLSLEDVIDVALARSVRLVNAPAGAFYMARPGSLELTREASMGLLARAAGGRRSVGEPPFREALAAGAPSVHPLPPAAAPGLEQGGDPTHVLVVPVQRGHQLLGTLEIYLRGSPAVPANLTELLQGVAAQAATAIRHAQIYREQEESSLTDELTRLPNRRYLGQRFLQERQRARRVHQSLGVLMLDLDHFKEINDGHGHLVGDAVLTSLAAILRQTLREADVAARYGGEEFAVVLHDTPLEGAVRLGERIRAAVESATFPHGLHVTVSVGVACSTRPDRFGRLFEMADSALYEAKRGGRNRVVAADEPEPAPQPQSLPPAPGG